MMAASSSTENPAGQRSALQMLTLLLRRRRLIIGLPVATAVAALAMSFLLPRLYTVEARFTAESSKPDVSRLMGLASQFGLDVGNETQSVDFYAELLESRELLRQAVLTEYSVPTSGDTLRGNLVELFDIDGDTEAERVRDATEAVGDLVTVRPDRTASIVSVEVSMPWPSLSVAVAQRLLQLTNEFNLERRQSRARAERTFLEERVDRAASELLAAEEELERFLDQNRRYAESPELRFEYARMQRRVDVHEDVHRTLRQAYEQARIDEVRNTPVITVLDPPRGPAERTSPSYLVNTVLGFLLGLLLALGILVLQELFAAARRARPAEFAELERETRDSVGAVLRWPFRKRNGGRSSDAPAPASRVPASAPRVAPVEDS